MQYFNLKNVVIRKLKDTANISNYDKFLQAILKMTYRPLSSGQSKLTTFSAINGNNADEPQYLHEIKNSLNETIGFALRVNIAKRDLPKKLIDNEVEKRVKKMENAGQKLEKADNIRIKEDVVSELLDKAFPKEKEIDIFIDLKTGLVFTGATSETIAENCFALIRKVLGTFPAAPLIYENPIETILNNIFLNDGVQLSKSKLTIALKFKLTETDTVTSSITNNFASCSLRSLQDLVKERQLVINQLELFDAENKMSFIVVAPKLSSNNSCTIKAIQTDLIEQMNEYTAGQEGASDEQKEKIDESCRQFTSAHLLKTMLKITENTSEMFGEVL